MGWCVMGVQSPKIGPLERVTVMRDGCPFGDKGTVMWLCGEHKLLVDKCMLHHHTPRIINAMQSTWANWQARRLSRRPMPCRPPHRGPSCNTQQHTETSIEQ